MAPAVSWCLVGLAAVAALLLVDRLLLAAEARGWIYWRKRKASPGSLGSAMLEIQSHLQASARHAVEEQRRVVREDDEAGEPPDPPEARAQEQSPDQ